jgi:hypothetical protein
MPSTRGKRNGTPGTKRKAPTTPAIPVSKQPKRSYKRKNTASTNGTRKKAKTSSPLSDEENMLIDDDADYDYTLDAKGETSENEDITTLKTYLQGEEKKLETEKQKFNPDVKPILEKISKAKATIKVLINKINKPNKNVLMDKKIAKLKIELVEKNDFLKTIFGETKQRTNLPIKNLPIVSTDTDYKNLKDLIDAHTKYLDSNSDDDDTWYAKCEKLQQRVCDNLEEAYQQAYKNYTTPLYLFLKKDGQEQNSDFNNLLKEFIEFIESKDPLFATNRDYAKRHIVISDLVWVIFMNTGLWRQLFKDGHKKLRLAGIIGDINSIAQKNAKTKHINYKTGPTDTKKIIRCPGCSRPILELNVDTIKKITPAEGGTPSAADHTNPVTHAFTEDTNEALVENLVMICQSCNSAKLNAHLIKFFNFLKTNKTTPLYNLLKPKNGLDAELPTGFGNKRLQFYIEIIHNMIVAGVNPIAKMVTPASEIKRVYDTSLELLEKSSEQYVEEELAALLVQGLKNSKNFAPDDKLYKQLLSGLFSIIIGVKKTKILTYEEVLEELFNEITNSQLTLTHSNLQEFFKHYGDSIIFNSIPNIKGVRFTNYADELATYLLKEIKPQPQSTSASDDNINKEEFDTYFLKFIEEESAKAIKNKDSAGKTKNLSKKKHKLKKRKSFLNQTLKGKMFKRKA